jgi:hypothetical protein
MSKQTQLISIIIVEFYKRRMSVDGDKHPVHIPRSFVLTEVVVFSIGHLLWTASILKFYGHYGTPKFTFINCGQYLVYLLCLHSQRNQHARIQRIQYWQQVKIICCHSFLTTSTGLQLLLFVCRPWGSPCRVAKDSFKTEHLFILHSS